MRPALLAAALLACCAPAADAHHACWPDGSRTVAKSRHARVYWVAEPYRTYGCLYSRDQAVLLAGGEDDGSYSYALRPLALAGPYVAYEWVWSSPEPYEPGDYYVRVVDLRDGSTKHGMLAWGAYGPRTSEEGFEPTVVRIRLRRDGAAAWVSDWTGDREVRRLDSRGGHRLDHGRHIRGKSLRITARRVYWSSDGIEKHASLR